MDPKRKRLVELDLAAVLCGYGWAREHARYCAAYAVGALDEAIRVGRLPQPGPRMTLPITAAAFQKLIEERQESGDCGRDVR